MDALAYAAPQVIVPGRVFERLYNAESIERAGAGVQLEAFAPNALEAACRRAMEDPSCAAASLSLRQTLASLGSADRIVCSIVHSLRS